MKRASLVQRLTDHTIALHEARTFEQLSQRATDAISDLVPGDWACVTFLPSVSPTPVVPRMLVSRQRADWVGVMDHAQALAHEDPVYTARLRLTGDGAAPYSNFMTHRAFRESRLYRDVWRTVGADDVLACHVPGRFIYGLVTGRSGPGAFDSADSALIDSLGRHLDAATARLVDSGNGTLSIGGRRAAISSARWLVCDRHGVVLRWKFDARELMARCLGPNAPKDRLAATWMRVLERRARGGPSEPLRYASRGESITVYIAPIRGSPDEWSVYFVVDPIPHDPASSLMALGLTRREAEVLRWVSDGKTGPEIGAILGMSALTAKKHMENVLRKLGVSTRAAAVSVATSAIQSGDRSDGPQSRT